MLELLRHGEATLWIRVPQTTPGGIDQSDWPSVRQRALTQTGRDQARAVGAALAVQGVPVTSVLTCPEQRCLDAAELAFGQSTVREQLENILAAPGDRRPRLSWAREALARPVPGRVLIGHSATMLGVTGVNVPEGGALVVVPDAGTGFLVRGTVSAQDWLTLARPAAAAAPTTR